LLATVLNFRNEIGGFGRGRLFGFLNRENRRPKEIGTSEEQISDSLSRIPAVRTGDIDPVHMQGR